MDVLSLLSVPQTRLSSLVIAVVTGSRWRDKTHEMRAVVNKSWHVRDADDVLGSETTRRKCHCARRSVASNAKTAGLYVINAGIESGAAQCLPTEMMCRVPEIKQSSRPRYAHAGNFEKDVYLLSPVHTQKSSCETTAHGWFDRIRNRTGLYPTASANVNLKYLVEKLTPHLITESELQETVEFIVTSILIKLLIFCIG